METFVEARARNGMILYDKNLGFVAWTIRWKSAGWENRDDMTVSSHNGFILNEREGVENGPFYMCDMSGDNPDGYGEKKVATTYFNQPSDAPGLIEMVYPYVFRIGEWHPAYFFAWWLLAFFADYVKKQKTKYDTQAILNALFLNTPFDGDADIICAEFVWMAIAHVEQMVGFRQSGTVTEIRPRVNPRSTEHDTFTYESNIIPFYWFFAGNKYKLIDYKGSNCWLNTVQTSQVDTPYFQQIKSSDHMHTRYPKAYFVE